MPANPLQAMLASNIPRSAESDWADILFSPLVFD
jgi:hypothetical protein